MMKKKGRSRAAAPLLRKINKMFDKKKKSVVGEKIDFMQKSKRQDWMLKASTKAKYNCLLL